MSSRRVCPDFRLCGSNAGYKANERPVRFQLGEREYVVEELLGRWYGPDHTYFKVRANDGILYILRRHGGLDDWTLESFRRPANE